MMMVSGLASDIVSDELAGWTENLDLTSLEHSDAAVSVDTSARPVATDPDVAELVGTAGLVGSLDGDELAEQTLPEVKTIAGRVKGRVGVGDEVHGIGDAKDAALVEAGVVGGGGRAGVDSNDERLDGVAAGEDLDVGRLADLDELNVVFVGADFSKYLFNIIFYMCKVCARTGTSQCDRPER